jgi:hypothetical protein
MCIYRIWICKFLKIVDVAVLTKSGRTAIASSVRDQRIHLAWGEGSEFWNATPEIEDDLATALVKEVGRRIADEVHFVVGDDDGEFVTPSGRFRAVDYPTNNLYMRFTFDFENAANKTIRELGVFTGTEINPELPIGQKYFEPQEIVNSGILLVLERTVPLIRTAATRESFSFVITF